MKEFCVDLDLSEELERNNFPQTSYGWYKPDYDGRDRKPVLLNVLASGTSKSPYNNLSHYRLSYTPNSDELLKELPEGFRISKNIHGYFISILDIKTTLLVRENAYKGFEDKKPSNALAKLWLYLKKEGHIK